MNLEEIRKKNDLLLNLAEKLDEQDGENPGSLAMKRTLQAKIYLCDIGVKLSSIPSDILDQGIAATVLEEMAIIGRLNEMAKRTLGTIVDIPLMQCMARIDNYVERKFTQVSECM